MRLAGIHHVTLLVDDEKRARSFYEDVLGFEEKFRPAFKFPGLFYTCGDQEIHIIITSRPQGYEDIFITIDGTSEQTFRHIHRHAAFVVPDLDELREHLEERGVAVLFDPKTGSKDDALLANMAAGWTKMYGEMPIFCLDPFGNLLEFVPGRFLLAAAG
jgi:catechol 2,3-dioxygenase-like lactoylglutathione lyase family enzyme